MLRAGDHVHHGPSGEDWVLACDERDGHVVPAGWPECMAKAEHCTLLKAADDAERLEMLTRAAATRTENGSYSWRKSLAMQQLAASHAAGARA